MKELAFLEYNKQNIFTNLIQAEHHLANLGSKYDMGFAQCVNKHLAFALGEADEAYMHSLVANPEHAPKYKELRAKIQSLIINFKNMTPEEAIKEVRAVRKQFESFNEDYNTEKCEACTINITKSLYTNKTIKKQSGGERMRPAEIGIMTTGMFAGKFAQWGAEYVDKAVGKENESIAKKPSTWINIAGGLGLELLALFALKRNPTIQLFTAAAGGLMLTKTVDYLKESTQSGSTSAIRARPVYTIRATPRRAVVQAPKVAGARAANVTASPRNASVGGTIELI